MNLQNELCEYNNLNIGFLPVVFIAEASSSAPTVTNIGVPFAFSLVNNGGETISTVKSNLALKVLSKAQNPPTSKKKAGMTCKNSIAVEDNKTNPEVESNLVNEISTEVTNPPTLNENVTSNLMVVNDDGETNLEIESLASSIILTNSTKKCIQNNQNEPKKKLSYNCCFCKKTFSSSIALLKHKKTKHPDALMTTGRMFQCRFCKKIYSWKKSLLIHQKLKHNILLDASDKILTTQPREDISNENANIDTFSATSLGIENVSIDLVVGRNEIFDSPSSNQLDSFESGSDMDAFLVGNFENFDIVENSCTVQTTSLLNVEELFFASPEEFEAWKYSIEDTTQSRFKKTRGNLKYKNYVSKCFACNRSGIHTPKINPQRRTKTQGSKKIGKKCKAFITAKFYNTGEVRVQFQAEHNGHGPDVRHLDLRHRERNQIKLMLQSDISYDVILKNLKNKPNYESLTRMQVYNIHQSMLRKNLPLVDEMTRDGWSEGQVNDEKASRKRKSLKQYLTAVSEMADTCSSEVMEFILKYEKKLYSRATVLESRFKILEAKKEKTRVVENDSINFHDYDFF